MIPYPGIDCFDWNDFLLLSNCVKKESLVVTCSQERLSELHQKVRQHSTTQEESYMFFLESCIMIHSLVARRCPVQSTLFQKSAGMCYFGRKRKWICLIAETSLPSCQGNSANQSC